MQLCSLSAACTTWRLQQLRWLCCLDDGPEGELGFEVCIIKLTVVSASDPSSRSHAIRGSVQFLSCCSVVRVCWVLAVQKFDGVCSFAAPLELW